MPEFPYYPTYPKDLNSDHKVLVMDNRTYGAYRRLLDIAWHEEPAASLPTNDTILAAYAKETLEGWREIAPLVLNCFVKRGNRWYQKRLRQEWEKLNAVKERQSAAGKQRWENRSANSSPQSLAHSKAHARAYGYNSDSDSSPGKVSAEREGNHAEIHRLALLAHSACGSEVTFADAVVRQNVEDMLKQGRTSKQIEAIIDWRKKTAHTHKPKRAASLTEPSKFEQWRTMQAEEAQAEASAPEPKGSKSCLQ